MNHRTLSQMRLEKSLRLATRIIVLLAIILLLAVVLRNRQPISPALIPASIHRAFIHDHPHSKDIHYSLSVDDSGISYLIDYEINGTRFLSEYNASDYSVFEAMGIDLGYPEQRFVHKTKY